MILIFFYIIAFLFRSTFNRSSLDPIRMMHAFLEEYIDQRGDVRFSFPCFAQRGVPIEPDAIRAGSNVSRTGPRQKPRENNHLNHLNHLNQFPRGGLATTDHTLNMDLRSSRGRAVGR